MDEKRALVLLVEDNQDHAELLKRSLDAVDRRLIKVVHVPDGEAALRYLGLSKGPGEPTHNPRPQLILLDLRLPRIDGLEVLRRIKGTRGVEVIPVVVLTTSTAASDIARAYSLRANSYLTKPVAFDRFRQMMRDLSRYWTVWNAVPHSGA